MADSKITHGAEVEFEAGSYLRVAGGPWWQTRMRIISIDSETQMTVRWHYFEEPWFRITVIYSLFWSNLMVWSVWYTS